MKGLEFSHKCTFCLRVYRTESAEAALHRWNGVAIARHLQSWNTGRTLEKGKGSKEEEEEEEEEEMATRVMVGVLFVYLGLSGLETAS
jgi:hypothetical protein